jgi:hypothetical protein
MRAAMLALPLISACGPVSVAQAERQCFLQARQAVNPLAGYSIGAGSDGVYTGDLGISISSDLLAGRDPSAVYDTCVIQKSGQLPRQPLTSRPDWRG